MKNLKYVLAFIIVGTFVIFNTIIVFFDETNLSLCSITKAFAQEEFNPPSNTVKLDQDWIEESANCFKYHCIMGYEFESICDCTYDIGICPLSNVDDCYDEGARYEIDGPNNCSPNRYTEVPC